MERRLTGLLIPVLIAVLVWLFFFGPGRTDTAPTNPSPESSLLNDPDVQQAIAAQQAHQFVPDGTVVEHLFGQLGGVGYQVTWSRYGAGIRSVLINDEYDSPQSRKKTEHVSADYYPIVPDYGGPRTWGYGLVLEGAGRTRFAKAIDDGVKNQLWEVEEPEPGDNEVRFTLDMEDGLVLEKVFRYVPGRRDIELEIILTNNGGRPTGAPSSYLVRMRGVHAWNPKQERVFQNPAVATGALRRGATGEQLSNFVSAGEAAGATLQASAGDAGFDFAGTTSRFFGAFLYPNPDDVGAQRAVTRVTTGVWPPQFDHLVVDATDPQSPGYTVEARSVPEVYLTLNLQVPAQDQSNSLRYHLYLGPKSATVFDEQRDYERFQVVMDQDLSPLCCCPVPGVVTLAKGVIWVLKAFQGIVGNWGVAIIMLTLLVRIILSPLNFNMQRTMRAHGSKMVKLKPQLDALQKKHKSNPKQLQMEMMKFNKEHKLLSAPLKGCLPIFVTMPIWFGLFTALRVMYELRGEGFLPGEWIDDLSTPDRLFATGFAWDPVAYFNFLPILMVGLWLYLQMGTPLPKDPQQRQMMVMMRFMPVMMGVMLYNYASGLMIYMCTSSVWGIVEQKITKRILGPISPEAAGNAPMPMM